MHLRRLIGVLALAVMASLFVLAQSGAVTVNVANDPAHGSFLVDGDGMALYMFANDAEGESVCTGDCAEAWPPLIAEGDVTAGAGVAGSLLSTIERADGSLQVAYAGMPLYYFVRDADAGDTTGQGVNDVWYLVSNFGEAIVPPEPEESEEADEGTESIEPMLLSQLQTEGSALFAQNCADCHGSQGEGGSGGPALAGVDHSDDRSIIRQVIYGGGHMPGFGNSLDNFQIASVVTHVRTAWGNEFAPVLEGEVAEYR